MIDRNRAELASDHAANATQTARAHAGECRKCMSEVPCELGSMLQRGALKIRREARDALNAYLPAGSQVTYHGHRREYQGQVWTVAGPSRRSPWSNYVLIGPGVAPFTATLASLRLTTREAQNRELLDLVRATARKIIAVMSKHGVTVAVSVDRADTGRVLVTWSSVEFIAAENRARAVDDEQVKQYLAAALYLIQVLRATCSARDWDEVRHVADRARKLADRAGVRV
ncbi:hypothetical protein ACFV0L_18675 [Streptosporangium canum]|uniref:hypothetical protein n=1 Tax=Streptosporangium canum TaxID=324952 RepID=UPI0036B1128A